MKEKNEDNSFTEEELLIFGAYAEVAFSLQKSNRSQVIYKGLAITWIIATYIGVGYCPSSYEVNLPLDPFLLVASIGVVSFLVLGAICYRDLVIEEKKIASAVHEGIVLEERYLHLLPQVYHNVVEMNDLLGYVFRKFIFYISFASILIVTISASVAAYLFLAGSNMWIIAFLSLLALIPFLFLTAFKITKNTDPYPVLKKIHEDKKNNESRQFKK